MGNSTSFYTAGYSQSILGPSGFQRRRGRVTCPNCSRVGVREIRLYKIGEKTIALLTNNRPCQTVRCYRCGFVMQLYASCFDECPHKVDCLTLSWVQIQFKP